MAAWGRLKYRRRAAGRLRRGGEELDQVEDRRRAIKTIVAIFVPGAGIIKAIIAIYDTIVFFIRRRSGSWR
jgi:hypothetical protein